MSDDNEPTVTAEQVRQAILEAAKRIADQATHTGERTAAAAAFFTAPAVCWAIGVPYNFITPIPSA